jgi:hypothetical protein
MTGHISAPLGDPAVDIDGAKVADLIMRGDEVLGKEVTDIGV